MKRKVLLTFFLLSYFIAFSHSIRMAVFSIDKIENTYELSINLDRDDLIRSVNLSYQCAPFEAVSSDMILDYLKDHFQLAFNNECIGFYIQEMVFDEDYIRLKGQIDFDESQVEKIAIYNTCLLDYNPGHMNIIRASLNNRSRSFRLSSERLQTVIQY